MSNRVGQFAAALAATAFVTAALAHDKIGANLNGVADFARNHEFVNVLRQARGIGQLGTPYLGRAPLGADGWPTADFEIIFMEAQAGVAGLGGTYKLSFTGQANLALTAATSGTITNKVFSAGTNTTTADVNLNEGSERLWMAFTSTGGAVKNIRLIRPGYDPVSPPAFTNEFMAHIARFSMLRFMDWSCTNGNNSVTWADRPQQRTDTCEDYDGDGHDVRSGARWETLVELANATGKDIWINIPHKADDTYVANLATLLRDTLNASTKVYVEYSNEVWNFGFEQASFNRDAAVAEVNANPSSVLRFDGTNDQNIWAFRRVGRRLKEISDIFRSVWGPGAINGRVRPVLAGQMANSFIAEEGLRVVDEGMGVRPRTVFHGIAGAPYIFPSATNDSQADEVPGITVQQILDGIAAGVANAPNEDSYQYRSHLALAAWNNVKVYSYEGGFDTFGSNNVANKRLANLDPQIRTHCNALVNGWHAAGFETFLWFNAGAASYDTQFGQWPLLEDMRQPAKPKNQCIDDVFASALPAITAGAALPGPLAGGSFLGSSNPSGSLANNSGPFGFPGYAQYLLRASRAGTHDLRFLVQGQFDPSIGVQVNGQTVQAAFRMPNSGSFVNSAALALPLRKGINALRFTRPPAAGQWTIQSFTLQPSGFALPDFNADGKPDLLWSNTANGATFIWRMNGAALASDQFMAQIDPSWKVQGVADFDGDGQLDVVWRNTADGSSFVWYLDEGTFRSDAFLFSLPPEWVIQGVADFNADGHPDFLMRNTASGVAFAWFFANNAAVGDQFLFGIDPSWKVEGVGDFDHDGQPDLLFRNMGSGLAFAWNTNWNGSSLSLGASTPPIFSIDPVWQVVQVADWNADGHHDLVFRNASSGVVFVWYMTGTSLGASDFIIQIDPSWEIVPRR